MLAEQYCLSRRNPHPWPRTAPHLAPQDDDPYVRKTAAICVAKLYDINPELVEDRGFLDMLRVGAKDKAGSRSNDALRT